ncbi:hypothetical protein [Halomonas sp. THAF5a]|nr:hypothetical protein [Halomonas sp. THAF5a]
MQRWRPLPLDDAKAVRAIALLDRSGWKTLEAYEGPLVDTSLAAFPSM